MSTKQNNSRRGVWCVRQIESVGVGEVKMYKKSCVEKMICAKAMAVFHMKVDDFLIPYISDQFRGKSM